MEVVAADFNNDPDRRPRVDLALCYRMVAHYGLTDQIYTHISARVPGAEDRFLLNRLGPGFEEMTAGDLVEVGFEAPPEGVPGEVPGDVTADRVNRAGHTIHSAIYMARPEVGCALHLHSRASMAVAALEEGLLPLNQISMQFYNRISYHDYEGIALDLDERERLIASLGGKNAMILRNHGLLTLGRTVAEAFMRAYYLEKACEIQMDALAMGQLLRLPPPEVCEHAAQQFDRSYESGACELAWAANRRIIDRVNPGYEG
jgi:ribulose-5-phosphate 4-epimerase/fuculose-1-phosphate aldolase